MDSGLQRRLVTFYSFKGGVGRSMALANVAWRLAEAHGLNVVAVDFDLEAPGLHRFFGLEASDTGVMTYLEAWKEAVQKQAETPPDVTRFLRDLPAGRRPSAGSVRLLSSGTSQANSAERIANFGWDDFYEHSLGGAALEKMREQLLAQADIVLVDSRTGLTDAGGQCTIQLPDAVVLMTAPNEQSIEGTEIVARSIASASSEQRAGRPQPHVWLVVARVPWLEDQRASEEWLDQHGAWFEKGLVEGLWLGEDHPKGLRTFVAPHRSKYLLGESIAFHEGTVREPLADTYEKLTAAVFERKSSLDAKGLTYVIEHMRRPIVELQAAVETATQQEDNEKLMNALLFLGLGLIIVKQYDDAEDALSRSAGIAVALRDASRYALARTKIARVRRIKDDIPGALRILNDLAATKWLAGSRDAQLHLQLEYGWAEFARAKLAAAKERFDEAIHLAQRIGAWDVEMDGFRGSIVVARNTSRLLEAARMAQHGLDVARKNEYPVGQREFLLLLSEISRQARNPVESAKYKALADAIKVAKEK